MKMARIKAKKTTALCEGKLHPHLIHYIGYCLQKLAFRMKANFDHRIENQGLVAPQFGMLVILNLEGTMTQNELGSYLAIDKASVVRMLDGLESKGVLKRTPSPRDRRERLVAITAKGRKALVGLELARARTEEDFFSSVSVAEREEFKKIVAKLLRGSQRTL